MSKEHRSEQASKPDTRPATNDKGKVFTKQRHQGGPPGPSERKDVVSRYMDRRRKAEHGGDVGSDLPKVNNIYEYLRLAPDEPENSPPNVDEENEMTASKKPKRRGFNSSTKHHTMSDVKGLSTVRLADPMDARLSTDNPQGTRNTSRSKVGDRSKASEGYRGFTRPDRGTLASRDARKGNGRKTADSAELPATELSRFDMRTETWPTLSGRTQEAVARDGVKATLRDGEPTTNCLGAPIPAPNMAEYATTPGIKHPERVALQSGETRCTRGPERVLNGVPAAFASTDEDEDCLSRQWDIYTERLKRSTTLGTHASTPAAALGLDPRASRFESSTGSQGPSA
ncbi:hypothetical protein LTR36_009299 [Oleoguttula mirabilis]|uniref:Uncharacterized protein n=1 Tax=Oleoguttula mirabilis TaxID=1507867 RepID=A0AAV9J5T0_9PEZI|nr:hypothetical protein LTR36_009299 [Oleoguttula mirabilis]